MINYLEGKQLNFTPYPYQLNSINQLIEWGLDGRNDQVNTFVSLIQSGKTFCACAAMGELYKKHKRIWVIVDREELLEQWWDSFFELNPDIPKKECWYIGDNKTPLYRKQIQFVQVQTLTRRFKNIKDEFKPDIIILDEAHGVGFQRVIDELVNKWNPKQINITATPVRAGNNKQQYIDKFPLWENPNPKNPLKGSGDKLWYIGATSKMMLDLKRWKNPNWIVASEGLSDKTAERFKGVTVRGGEYDDTSQAAVMIDLIPDHIQEWKNNGGESRSTIWYAVNKRHCIEVVKALQKECRKVALVLSGLSKEDETLLNAKGVVTNRKEAIRLFRLGELTDLVNCQCLTTGFSASIASCAVWLRRTMSFGLFCQMSGRALTYHPDFDTALLMDFAGNLGTHKGVFPETVDWLDYQPSRLIFRDPNQVVCKVCKYRHDGNPKPQHSTDSKIRFSTKYANFSYPKNYEGIFDTVSFSDVIKCEKCKEPVYHNPDELWAYSRWLNDVKSAVMSGEKPPKFKGDSAGISIGKTTERITEPLTLETMYDTGLWSLIEEGEDKDESNFSDKDRSEQWLKIRARQLEALEGKSLRLKKLSKLTEEQRVYIETYDINKIISLQCTEARYRTALGYMYLSDKSPLKSISYWVGESRNPPKNLVREALERIYNQDEESYEMLRSWIHKHHEEQSDNAKKGVLKGFLKTLAEIK